MKATNRTFLLVFLLFFHSTDYGFAQGNYIISLLDSAELLKYKQQYREATVLCIKAGRIANEQNKPSLYANSLAELADIYRAQKAFDKTDSLLKLASSFLRKQFDSRAAGYIEVYRGRLYSSTLNKKEPYYHDSVLACFNRAETLFKNRLLKAFALFRAGKVYETKGNTDIAGKYYRRVLSLLQEDEDLLDYKRAIMYYNISRYYRIIGDAERAVLLARLARHIYLHPAVDDKLWALNSEILLANHLFYAGRYEEALLHYDQAVEMGEQSGKMDYTKLLLTFINRSQPLLYLGRYNEVIENDLKSIKLNKKETPFDNILLYYTYNTLAEAYEKAGNYENAEKYFIKSLQLRLEVNGEEEGGEDVYDGYLYLGAFYGRMGKQRVALDYFQKSLKVLFPQFKPKSYYDNPDFNTFENKDWLLYVIFYKAGALYNIWLEKSEQKDLLAAYNLFKAGYKILNELLGSDFTREAMLNFFERFDREFNYSVECALDLYRNGKQSHYFNEAFKFIENNRYFLLYKSLARSGRDLASGIPDSLRYKQRLLDKEVIVIKRKMETVESQDSVFESGYNLLGKLNEQTYINEFTDSIAFRDKLAQTPLNVGEIQTSLLHENEAIIEYHWSNRHINILVIGRDFLTLYQADLNPELIENIDDYIRLVSTAPNGARPEISFRKYADSSWEIYDNLLRPALAGVKDQKGLAKKNIRRLILVPDGKLSFMPFEALLTQRPDASDNSYWGLPYLIRKYQISYAYSLNILKMNLEAAERKNAAKFLGFSYSAPNDFKNTISERRQTNELSYASEELQRIKKHVASAEILMGDEATEDAFKASASQYTVVHLAIHGVADTIDIFNSKLIFKTTEKSAEDGQLHAYELYDMDLANTRLAVLSACETGIGKQYEGEGIFSIARGFAYAGCPSIVMSLWDVNDKATAELMDYFYGFIGEGYELDKALQNAKLKYLENANDLSAHPSNWAAFIAMGNNRPVPLPASQWWIFLVSAMLILVVSFFLYKKRN